MQKKEWIFEFFIVLLITLSWVLLASVVIIGMEENKNHTDPSSLACRKLGYDYAVDGWNNYCVKNNKYYPVVLKCDLTLKPDRCRVYEIVK